MYRTLEWGRHWRAKTAQATGVPLVWWWGPWLVNNVPYTEDVTVVTFDPFPASKYGIHQVAQAHADYCKYLHECFESRKVDAGYPHKRLEIIGRHTPPTPRGGAQRRHKVQSKL